MSQQGSQNDSSMDALWIAAVAMLIAIMVKIWFGEELSWLYSRVRLGWIQVITSVWEKPNLMAAKRMLLTRDISEISGAQLGQLSKDLRFFMFPFWGALVGYIGYKAIKKNPGKRFRRRLSRADLAKEMSEFFPWTLPALQQDLLKAPIHKGKWAMAFPPLQFARQYGLLNGKVLDEKRAEKLFASQLGKLWAGPDRLNKYNKALFATFAAQVCRDKDGADAAQRELVVSITQNKPNFTVSDKLFELYKNDPRVVRICNRHAYQYTVLMALFQEGKVIGIFPPNHFLWLRPLNRKMWLTINCILRRTYFAEVAGIYAHYLAERVAKHRIEYPYVKKAVAALDLALRDTLFETAVEETEAPTHNV